MFKDFETLINNQYLHYKKKTVLVAVSAGVDSVVLLHLLHCLGFRLIVAHCNFDLRSKYSILDQVFVQNLASELGLPFYTKKFETLKYSKSEKVSIQMAARALRYDWFNYFLKTNKCAYIATAHHLNDQIETFFVNLGRGSGIDGLLGISSKKDTFFRPLLSFTKQQILDYAIEKNIPWREDNSNKEDKYLRNKIRHNIIPQLEKSFPNFIKSFLMTTGHLKEVSEYLTHHLEEARKSVVEIETDSEIKFNIAKCLKLKPLKIHLRFFFKSFGFNQWDDIQHILTTHSGKKIYSKSHILLKDRMHLILKPVSKTENEKQYKIYHFDALIDVPIALKLSTTLQYPVSQKGMIQVDVDKINPPLILRKHKIKDYFCPKGMQGKRKKMTKYFKDEKYSFFEKQDQWLLCTQTDVVWVVGKRLDERFKVTSQTKHILTITLI